MREKCVHAFLFSLSRVANGTWDIESDYPTQDKVRLECCTRHYLSVYQKHWRRRVVKEWCG
jgi:uncharacterized Zn finger protein